MSLKLIREYLNEYSQLKSIQALLHWDMETMMPSGAIEDRAGHLSYIQGKLHSHITSKRYHKLLMEMEKEKLSSKEKKLLKELQWDYHQNNALPASHVKELSHTQTIATHVWQGSRSKNNWKEFEPHLQKLIDLKKKEATYFKAKTPYDALLKNFDKEFTSKEIAKLFSDLKQGLKVIVEDVESSGYFTKIKDLKGPFPVSSQKELSQFVTSICGLPPAHSRLDESVHPFSINISPLDQRITTRYTTENLDSLSSTMHEVGHALYEHNLPRKWAGTPFQEAISYSFHESQSRFWENMVGRSSEFCQYIHPKMKELFPRAMKGVNEDLLFRIFNKSVPGLIRVESCELYYNFHIIIRYEIEEMIFNQGLKAKDIPEIWNEKYKNYLGLSPKNHAAGVLQDSHWAGGAFGYFPSYTLGNLISGTIYQKMKKELKGFNQYLRSGKLAPVGDYLNKNFHSKGRSVSTQEILGEIDVTDYLEYLKQKFEV